MKKKIVFLVVLTLVLTSVLGFAGVNTLSATAATSFQRVNFVSAQVTASALNVRVKPSTSSRIVCVLKKNQTVKVFGKLGDWYAIYEPATNCVGAASAKYLKAVGTTASTTPKTTSQLPTTNPPSVQKSVTPTTGLSQDEQTLISLCNAERKKAGAGVLQADTNLMKMARIKAKDMVDNNYFSHYSPTYGSPFDMMKQFGVVFKAAGENIAGNKTVDAAFKAWMNSAGHKKNILNGNFNYTGIGIVSSPTYGKILVQEFIMK